MKRGRTSVLALGLLAGTVLLAGGVVLMLMVLSSASPDQLYEYWLELLIFTPIVGVLGAIILAHQSRHPIGLVLVLSAAANAVGFAAGSYAAAASVWGWPLAPIGAWAANLLRETAFVLAFSLLLLLYPTGAALGRIGRAMVRTVVVAVGALLLTKAFGPGPLADFAAYLNPLGVPAADEALEVVAVVSNVLILGLGIVGGVTTIVIRLIRSRDVERLQIRVFFYATVVAITGLLVANLALSDEMEGALGSVLWTVFPMIVVAAMALAIVRYRLFDIDRLISRTISYAILTALLAGLYLGLVFAISDLTPFEGDLPVAASTLVLAAAFNPVRRRVQAGVDRRFNRAPYDATVTVESFSKQLRNFVGLDDVVEALHMTTAATMYPAWLSLWLRD